MDENIRAVSALFALCTHDTLAFVGDITADKTLVEILSARSVLGSVDMESLAAVKLVGRLA